jgi:hypothetical protein
MKLWADVPETQRVTDHELRERAIGYKDDDPGWLADRRSLLLAPRCHAAVPFWSNRDDVWQPCSLPPRPGETFCAKHGGKKVVTLSDTVSGWARRRYRLERQRLTAIKAVRRAMEDIRWIDIEIRTFESQRPSDESSNDWRRLLTTDDLAVGDLERVLVDDERVREDPA